MIRQGKGLLCGLLLVLAGRVLADPNDRVAELQEAGRLQIETSIAPTGQIVPGQKVAMTIMVATDRWFSGGTRIGIPEVPGLVILQTQQFASNASETRGNQSWVIQRWTLDIYPQRAGEFTVPPISVRVKVNAGDEGDVADVTGDLSTAPASFSVEVPPDLAQAQFWVAAPAFELRQSFDRPLQELQVGDAFEREIEFQASDVLAMMLPSVQVQDIPGLAAYPSPPVLTNSSNRGEIRAGRIERTSYIVQEQGNFRLPALDYFWWDTASAQLKLLSLPATEFTVGSGAASATYSIVEQLQITPRRLLATLAGLVLLSGLIWWAWTRLPALPGAKLQAGLSVLRRQLQQLRKPALPARLNPGSSAGE